ncbi:kinase-like protein, partial [Punctularia strigosozonata HHB-11173 SS5]
LCREALSWRQLRHSRIVPFLGLDQDVHSPCICMVSPCMPGGNLLDLVKLLRCERLSNISMQLVDTLEGLRFLHSEGYIHGDLRAANVLLDADGHACLADFGLISFLEGADQSTMCGGNPRWMAPELVISDNFQRTRASDMYSFGCVCLEIITLQPPFPEMRIPSAIIRALMEGRRPIRPANKQCIVPVLHENLWKIVESCWNANPGDRPSASQAL